MRSAWLWRLAALIVALAAPAFAEAPPESAPVEQGSRRVPVLPPSLGDELNGRPITRVEVLVEGGRFAQPASVTEVQAGQAFSPEVARRALQELLDTGRYADAKIAVEEVPDGVVLRFRVVPRRVVARVEVSGAPFPSEDLLRRGALHVGDELTARDLPRIAARVERDLAERGFRHAKVTASALDTDDPLNVVVSLDVKAGAPEPIVDRWFGVWPDPKAPGLRAVLAGYEVGRGDRADAEALTSADKNLRTALRVHGWHRAEVTHSLEPRPGGEFLRVEVQAGPRIELVFEGNRSFDADALESALNLEDSEERDPQVLVDRLHEFYENRGFFDAEVRVEERGAKDAPVHQLAFVIREARALRIVAREYPCLAGKRPHEVGSEIDSFLSDLPGSELLGPVDDNAADLVYGPTAGHGRTKAPLTQNPWGYYVTGVYDKAIEHLRDLFRSQGYLSATVGPATLLRRTCDPHSQPGACIPIGERKRPPMACRYDSIGLPLEEASPDPALTCHPDPRHGVSCEPEAVLYLPIKLGPRTDLYDIAFEGNHLVVERELADAAELSLGAPISQLELENARRRLVDLYAEEGFAFAEVDATLDLSSDHRHGRARFTISERQPVRVQRIEIRGADRTHEGIIRRRLAFKAGELYKRSLVRRSEELLAQLGVFSTVSIGFDDPYVPAREKVVVVTVEEKMLQYVTTSGGVATGDGVTGGIEYGYRNIAGAAIQFTLSSQLGYLPDALILESDVRRKYDELTVLDRLERRNTVTIRFPEIGLGPLFRLEVSGVDVRDNARDYGITKDAALVTLFYRPTRRLGFQAGASLERNVATIFGSDQKGALQDYVEANPQYRNIFRVPEGTTFAIAEQLRVTWDRRDRPLDATQGTVVSLGAEHVHAEPIGESATPTPPDQVGPFTPSTSDFMRYDGRVAGYVRLSKRGMALALSLRAGVIQQLFAGSHTYPDRLFFLGGIDSIRGFAQDSLVPEDIAEQLLAPPSSLSQPLTIDEVVIRGGDAFVNPRAELRIPLTNSVQTALFVDSGNLWTDPKRVDLSKLRYATGTGIRIGTPIGPLAFDYGFNVERVLDHIWPSRKNQRYWESLGAFHFSIGVL
jgi:outer membrane protein assembly factor BamA